MNRATITSGALALCLAGLDLSVAACSSGPASCAAQLAQWENSGVSSELRQINSLINAPFPGAEDGPLDLKPATVSAWFSYLAAHPIPSCASTQVTKDYGALQADVVFLKADVTLFSQQLEGAGGGTDISSQVSADGTAVQGAIAKLQGNLPAGG